MTHFYRLFILTFVLLFSSPLLATPVLNIVPDNSLVSKGDTVRFNLAFSESVGGTPDDFLGMSLYFSYDTNFLKPLYGLGTDWQGNANGCTYVNCGSNVWPDLYDDDFRFFDDSGSTALTINPFWSPLSALTDIGFISFEVIADNSVDTLISIAANGTYDTFYQSFIPISGAGSVTVQASQSPPGTIPEPALLSLMLIGLAGLFAVSKKTQ